MPKFCYLSWTDLENNIFMFVKNFSNESHNDFSPEY